MPLSLNRAQKVEVEALVAQGWPRAAAELMVMESQEDVIEDNPEPRIGRDKPA